MNKLSTVNPQKSVDLDSPNLYVDEEGSSYLLNATIEDIGGNRFAIGNEPSNLLATALPADKQVVGFVYVPEHARLLLLTTRLPDYTLDTDGTRIPVSPTRGAILEIRGLPKLEYDRLIPQSGCYTQEHLQELSVWLPRQTYEILTEADFNWSIHQPVDAQYKLTHCQLHLYFVDGRNPDRYIYFDYETPSSSLQINEDFFTAGVLDLDKSRLKPLVDSVVLDVESVSTGGNLTAGTYQFYTCFSDAIGNALTDYTNQTNPVPIWEKTITVDTDYKTTKHIRLGVTVPPTTFEFYTIVVLETVNNNTRVYQLGTYPITQTTVIFSGTETTVPSSLQEVLGKRVYYENSKGIGSSNGYLFRYGLKEKRKPNLQRIANLIKVYWQTVQLKEGDYKDPLVAEKYRGYMRDEVYPLGFILEYDDGDTSCIAHIPGRASVSSDLTVLPATVTTTINILGGTKTITFPNPQIQPYLDKTCDGNTEVKQWQVNNTGSVLQRPHELFDPCKDTIWEWGNMAYWESTELYPNDEEQWGALAGQPIRHHKFPDSLVTHIHSQEGDKGFDGINYIYPIGFHIDHTSIATAIQEGISQGWIHPDDARRITGYRIVRGNRVGHESVQAKGLLYDMWKYTKWNQTYYAPNYPYNDLRADPFISQTKTVYDWDKITPTEVHSPAKAPWFVEPPTTNNTGNRYGPFDTYEEAQALVPNPPNDEGWTITGTIYTEYVYPETTSDFTTTGRYTFHSPDVHFKEPGQGTIIKLETEEWGEGKGFFSPCEGQSREKLLTGYAVGYCVFLAQINSMFDTMKEVINVVSDTVSLLTPTNSFSYTVKPSSNQAVQTDASKTVPIASQQHEPITSTGSFFLNLGNLFGPSPERMIKLLTTTNSIKEYLKSTLGWFNHTYQFNSVGKYTGFTKIPYGTSQPKIMPIKAMAKLDSTIQTVQEDTGVVTVNNRYRESSVYLKVQDGFTLGAPVKTDRSRFLASSVMTFEEREDRKESKFPISSFYGSIKNYLPNQYGSIYSIQYLETASGTHKLTGKNSVVFGGDTFINRFYLKRKHSFFSQTRFKLPDGSPVNYSLMGNAGYPIYFYDTNSLFGNAEETDYTDFKEMLEQQLFKMTKARFDLDQGDRGFQRKGIIYLYSYGIPGFICESGVNVDLRHAEDSLAKNFYPNIADLENWLQEQNVSPKEDNWYSYNTTYSKQNRENNLCVPGPLFVPNQLCKVNLPKPVIYSEQVGKTTQDAWLVNRPNNYYDFPLTSGTLVSVDGIENEKVLVRQTLGSSIFNAYVEIQTTQELIQVGTGGMFRSKPQQYATTDLGYFGSQHRVLLNTEYGHVSVDSDRGVVYLLGTSGSGLEELSKYRFYRWFKENLPFQIKKDFPAVNIDQWPAGIGITMGYDPKGNRVLLTKLDYQVLSNQVQYDQNTESFYVLDSGKKVYISIQDKRYFCAKHWTVGYHFQAKNWIFYSFTPNLMISQPFGFYSILNGLGNGTSSMWLHGTTNQHYQTFYGKLYPFMVETGSSFEGVPKQVQSVEYKVDVVQYYSQKTSTHIQGITYPKAIIYNSTMSSGILQLVPADPTDVTVSLDYPKKNQASWSIPVFNVNTRWRFNQFKNLTIPSKTYTPIWVWNCGNSYKYLNNKSLNYQHTTPTSELSRIKGENNRIVFINDQYNQYKFIHHFSLLTEVPVIQ